MESFMLKTEVQNNGEILLYYVDENGENQEGVLTTIDSIENNSVQIQDSYMLDNYDELVDDPPELEQPAVGTNLWSDDDTKRLLTFYNDNKTSFVSGTTKKRHLWAVACKTMLIGKNQQSCEEKLDELKIQYSEVRTRYVDKGIYVKWPFLDLCHTAFHDDVSIAESILPDSLQKVKVQSQSKITVISQEKITNDMKGILSVKQISTKSPDEQTKLLLNTYMKYKEKFQKEHWRRDLWDKIAEEVGEDDSEYLQKKFLNHKQHYISLYIKRKQFGPSSVVWPYMELFDKIYRDDAQFLKKHFNETLKTEAYHSVPEHEWNISQKMILVKYYFDCYEEFQDVTIPQKFLWTEVGRLVDKKPETCQTRYEMLRREHLEKHVAGDYNIQKRLPLAILFDNIILKDVKIALSKMDLYDIEYVSKKEERSDELVQFFFSNMEVFKDHECHFVCWAAVAHKLKESIETCKRQWDELVVLYKQILEEKKEDPDLQIDWRYIDLFDRIFDYGMDEALLKGYDVGQEQNSNHVLVKKVNINPEDLEPNGSQVEHTTPTLKRETRNNVIDINEPRTDPRSTKILEYHLKNKDKFQSAKNKLTIWDHLANHIGMNATECAHRFKTLKHTYIEFIKKEIDKPRIPITWPYYALCKRVFGYRIIKNKLKQGDVESDSDDWSEREIKLLISFFSRNFHVISNNIEDVSKWTPLASDIGKSETNCKEKFVELRKCYRKLKTMRTRNPDVKISWSYFNMFDRIYSMKDEPMEVVSLEEEHLEQEVADDDYQCIIVLQDGQVILNNSEVNTDLIKQLQMSDGSLPQMAENNASSDQRTLKWTKRTKKRLLISYINYVRSHRGKEISSKDMWSKISSKIRSKTSKECRKMLVKMMNSYKRSDETVIKNSPFSFLLEKVFKLKPKFTNERSKEKFYKDVQMASEKVILALQYYLEHIDDFVNPKFEKKYLWTQLANYISEPLSKVYNKINFLKQAYDIETEEINGKKTEFSDLLKEVIAKEVAVKIVLDVNVSPEFSDAENSWTDDEVEQLLIWYLGNLDKFKNPKFNRSYLWMDASCILSKSPLVCSKKMSEIRSQYRNMVKENGGSEGWRFFELCQKIYGTGKRNQSLLDELIFVT